MWRLRKLLFIEINLSLTFYNDYLSVIISLLFLLRFHFHFFLKETFVKNYFQNVTINIVRAEVVQKMTSIYRHFYRHFLRTPQKQWVLDHTPRHRSLIGKGGQLFALVCFRETHKGFQSFHSTENKGKQNELSAIHLQYTFVCSFLPFA